MDLQPQVLVALQRRSQRSLTVVHDFPALGECKYYVGGLKKQYYVGPFKVRFCLFKQACACIAFSHQFSFGRKFLPFQIFPKFENCFLAFSNDQRWPRGALG